MTTPTEHTLEMAGDIAGCTEDTSQEGVADEQHFPWPSDKERSHGGQTVWDLESSRAVAERRGSGEHEKVPSN